MLFMNPVTIFSSLTSVIFLTHSPKCSYQIEHVIPHTEGNGIMLIILKDTLHRRRQQKIHTLLLHTYTHSSSCLNLFVTPHTHLLIFILLQIKKIYIIHYPCLAPKPTSLLKVMSLDIFSNIKDKLQKGKGIWNTVLQFLKLKSPSD